MGIKVENRIKFANQLTLRQEDCPGLTGQVQRNILNAYIGKWRSQCHKAIQGKQSQSDEI